MSTVLTIGGSRFIGRHTVEALLEAGHQVTLFNRGNRPDPFDDHDRTAHVTGDRQDTAALADAARSVDPDIVVDCVAYAPDEVEAAVEVFADVDAYVFVSSVAAYVDDPIVKYEGETPLEPCTPEQATDDSWATYGPRKAECDRVIADAGDEGIAATSVRPSMVYGPYDYTPNMAYWIGRIATQDRIIVPGDGAYVPHRTYVENVATAILTVAEHGEPGAAYNVADRQPQSLGQTVESIRAALDTGCEFVYAGPRELAKEDLSVEDFPYYRQRPPFVLSTEKLRALGWDPIDVSEAIARTVEHVTPTDGVPDGVGPSVEAEQRLAAVLADGPTDR